ncbi:kelch-like protein 12 [Styela clava]
MRSKNISAMLNFIFRKKIIFITLAYCNKFNMAADFGIQDNEHNNLMMQKLDDMRKEKRLSDFTIKVGKKEFPVHKNVMSAGSDYFDAMLFHDNLESNTGIVDMKEVDVDSVNV